MQVDVTILQVSQNLMKVAHASQVLPTVMVLGAHLVQATLVPLSSRALHSAQLVTALPQVSQAFP